VAMNFLQIVQGENRKNEILTKLYESQCSEQLLKKILESVDEGIIIYDSKI
jgi:hypothetical protein